MALPLYSPADVIFSIAGIHTVTGYADGTFIRISKNAKPFEQQRAMDGTLERMYHYDDGYTIELTLAQSSSSNNVLSVLNNIDILSRKMKFPLMIKDTYGQTSFFAATAWIEKIPDVVFGTTLEPRVWTLQATDAILTVGGNGDTSALEDAVLSASAFLPVLKQFGFGV